MSIIHLRMEVSSVLVLSHRWRHEEMYGHAYQK